MNASMCRPLLIVCVVVALTGRGGSDTTPADPVADICERLRAETQAMLDADTFNERMDAINESDITAIAKADGLTGPDIRARCNTDVDRNLTTKSEILADPYGLD